MAIKGAVVSGVCVGGWEGARAAQSGAAPAESRSQLPAAIDFGSSRARDENSFSVTSSRFP